MNGIPINSDAVAIVLEIQRLAKGGTPHGPDSPEALTLNAALDALAQDAELAALSALGRKCFAAAVNDLQRPLHGEFSKNRGPGTHAPRNPSTERQL